MYAFSFHDSAQKDIDEDSGVFDLAEEYTIPTLTLENVEFRHFLMDYQALIHVETDNYIL